MKAYNKAWAASLTPVVGWVLKGIVTGDWTPDEGVAAGISGLILGAVVWRVPNREVK